MLRSSDDYLVYPRIPFFLFFFYMDNDVRRVLFSLSWVEGIAKVHVKGGYKRGGRFFSCVFIVSWHILSPLSSCFPFGLRYDVS